MRFNRRNLSIGGAAVAVAAAVTAVVLLGQPATSNPAQDPTIATASNSSSTSTTTSNAPLSTVAVTTTTALPAPTTATSTRKAVTHAVAQDTTTDGGSDPIVTGTNEWGVPNSKSVTATEQPMCNVAPPGQPASLVPCPNS